MPPISHSGNRGALVEAYEALRPDGSARASLGRALLIQRGLAAWAGAWSTPATPPARPSPASPLPPTHAPVSDPTEATDEATHILVSMVLTHLRYGETCL